MNTFKSCYQFWSGDSHHSQLSDSGFHGWASKTGGFSIEEHKGLDGGLDRLNQVPLILADNLILPFVFMLHHNIIVVDHFG